MNMYLHIHYMYVPIEFLSQGSAQTRICNRIHDYRLESDIQDLKADVQSKAQEIKK